MTHSFPTRRSSDLLRALTIKRQAWLDLLAASGVSFKIITVREELSHQLPGEYDHPRLSQIHNAWMQQFKTTYINRHYLLLTQLPSKLTLLAKFKSSTKQKARTSDKISAASNENPLTPSSSSALDRKSAV